jgi:hypothetical protein
MGGELDMSIHGEICNVGDTCTGQQSYDKDGKPKVYMRPTLDAAFCCVGGTCTSPANNYSYAEDNESCMDVTVVSDLDCAEPNAPCTASTGCCYENSYQCGSIDGGEDFCYDNETARDSTFVPATSASGYHLPAPAQDCDPVGDKTLTSGEKFWDPGHVETAVDASKTVTIGYESSNGGPMEFGFLDSATDWETAMAGTWQNMRDEITAHKKGWSAQTSSTELSVYCSTGFNLSTADYLSPFQANENTTATGVMTVYSCDSRPEVCDTGEWPEETPEEEEGGGQYKSPGECLPQTCSEVDCTGYTCVDSDCCGLSSGCCSLDYGSKTKTCATSGTYCHSEGGSMQNLPCCDTSQTCETSTAPGYESFKVCL